jgi:hypothetical protein
LKTQVFYIRDKTFLVWKDPTQKAILVKRLHKLNGDETDVYVWQQSQKSQISDFEILIDYSSSGKQYTRVGLVSDMSKQAKMISFEIDSMTGAIVGEVKECDFEYMPKTRVIFRNGTVFFLNHDQNFIVMNLTEGKLVLDLEVKLVDNVKDFFICENLGIVYIQEDQQNGGISRAMYSRKGEYFSKSERLYESESLSLIDSATGRFLLKSVGKLPNGMRNFTSHFYFGFDREDKLEIFEIPGMDEINYHVVFEREDRVITIKGRKQWIFFKKKQIKVLDELEIGNTMAKAIILSNDSSGYLGKMKELLAIRFKLLRQGKRDVGNETILLQFKQDIGIKSQISCDFSNFRRNRELNFTLEDIDWNYEGNIYFFMRSMYSLEFFIVIVVILGLFTFFIVFLINNSAKKVKKKNTLLKNEFDFKYIDSLPKEASENFSSQIAD